MILDCFKTMLYITKSQLLKLRPFLCLCTGGGYCFVILDEGAIQVRYRTIAKLSMEWIVALLFVVFQSFTQNSSFMKLEKNKLDKQKQLQKKKKITTGQIKTATKQKQQWVTKTCSSFTIAWSRSAATDLQVLCPILSEMDFLFKIRKLPREPAKYYLADFFC